MTYVCLKFIFRKGRIFFRQKSSLSTIFYYSYPLLDFAIFLHEQMYQTVEIFNFFLSKEIFLQIKVKIIYFSFDFIKNILYLCKKFQDHVTM